MVNEFSGYIAHRLCRMAALRHETQKRITMTCVLRLTLRRNHRATMNPKTHPSWG